jgi:hypothetical protein
LAAVSPPNPDPTITTLAGIFTDLLGCDSARV